MPAFVRAPQALALAAALGAALLASAALAQAPSPLAPIEDEPGLPRVLLIGDSISIGYTLPTRALLKGKANVHRIPANGGSTKSGVANLAKWLGDRKWSVIHFNFGIHDAKFLAAGKQQVPPEEYEANLRKIVQQLQGTGARLIFATTTPIPAGELKPPRSFDKVDAYNAIARKVMQDAGVTINDLNAHVAPHVARLQNPQDVHFSKAGSEFLAEKVAAAIAEQLPAPPPK